MSNTAPLTPSDAARVLWQIDQEMTTHTNELVRLRLALPGLARAAKLAYARAYLSSDGSIEAKKQMAAVAADDAKFALDTHEQMIEARKDSLKTLRERSEIGRSLNSNLKEELRVLGSGVVAA